MRNIKLTIQYDGTRYSGWQSQKNSVAVQDVMEKALSGLLGEKVKLIGASRTDANVHAAGQVANFRTGSRLSLLNIKNGLNRRLPKDIVVLRAAMAKEAFHAQYDAKSKIYRYRVYAGNPVPPFFKDFVARTSYELDTEIMSEEAKALLGRHDFISFQGANSPRKETIRSIKSIRVKKRGKLIEFHIEADGFLYNMARAIVGTLIDIGRGHMQRGSVKEILAKRERRFAGATAPAKGLCLMKVGY
ncbi:MAG: tRNA pseudouridine(38-40) synthase TruA [Candidatus Omnitrophota bacterium]